MAFVAPNTAIIRINTRLDVFGVRLGPGYRRVGDGLPTARNMGRLLTAADRGLLRWGIDGAVAGCRPVHLDLTFRHAGRSTACACTVICAAGTQCATILLHQVSYTPAERERERERESTKSAP